MGAGVGLKSTPTSPAAASCCLTLVPGKGKMFMSQRLENQEDLKDLKDLKDFEDDPTRTTCCATQHRLVRIRSFGHPVALFVTSSVLLHTTFHF